MDIIPANAGRETIVAAIEANFVAGGKSWAAWPSLELIENDVILAYTTGLPHPLGNGIVQARFPVDQADKHIKEAINLFSKRRLPFIWWVTPASQPSDLAEKLLAYGLAADGETPGMVADLRQLSEQQVLPAGLALTWVQNETDLAQWQRPFATGFQIPDNIATIFAGMMGAAGLGVDGAWQNVIGWLDGEPVACASLFLGEGVAGIYNVTTIPTAQRQGIGTAVTLALMQRSKKQGAELAVLESSSQGTAVYERLGFKAVCSFSQFVWTPDVEETSS